jgi:hypothetical protein
MRVIGFAFYVLMLLAALVLLFASLGAFSSGSVVGGLICLVLGGLLAAFSIVMLRRRWRATRQAADTGGLAEATQPDIEPAFQPLGANPPVEHKTNTAQADDDYGRGVFARAFLIFLVLFVVTTGWSFLGGRPRSGLAREPARNPSCHCRRRCGLHDGRRSRPAWSRTLA